MRDLNDLLLDRLGAAEYTIKFLVALLALDHHTRDRLEANLRSLRLDAQQQASGGNPNPMLEQVIDHIERALGWPVVSPPGVRPVN